MQVTDTNCPLIRCQTSPTPSPLPRSTRALHIAFARFVRVQAIKARRTLHLPRCGTIERPRGPIVLPLPSPGFTCRCPAEAAGRGSCAGTAAQEHTSRRLFLKRFQS